MVREVRILRRIVLSHSRQHSGGVMIRIKIYSRQVLKPSPHNEVDVIQIFY